MFLKSLIKTLIFAKLSATALGADHEEILELHKKLHLKSLVEAGPFEFDINPSSKRPALLQNAKIMLAQGIENPFEIPLNDYQPELVEEPPMVVPKKKLFPLETTPLQPVAHPPAITLAMEEAMLRPLEFEFSMSLGYVKLRNWNSRQEWDLNPTSGFSLGYKWLKDSNAMTGIRVLSITGAGTTQDTTGNFSFTYLGPYIAHVEVSEKSQTSFSTGFSLAKISGKTQVGPGEQEFESTPGIRTDPPGLWAEAKYGKMTGGAWSNGITTGIQWGRKRLFYWLGLYSSAWY